MGGAQFALPGAIERLRSGRADDRSSGRGRTLVLAAADPAQPYGAALPWPRREDQEHGRRATGRPARVAGAYVVMVGDEPVLYVERGGRGLVTLVESPAGSPAPAGSRGEPLLEALAALAEAVRGGRVGKLALERIDGEPAISSDLAEALIELGFHSGPRKLTLSA
jgi:ATP-dependent Lhr-like helicase